MKKRKMPNVDKSIYIDQYHGYHGYVYIWIYVDLGIYGSMRWGYVDVPKRMVSEGILYGYMGI